MTTQFLYPVMLEDCNQWSDEKILFIVSKRVEPTEDFISRRNAALSCCDIKRRVVPGSIKRLWIDFNITELEYKVSAILFKVYQTECQILADIGSGRVYHERYRATAVESAMIAADTMGEDFAKGIDKPWNRPLAWIKDGENIVLIRSEIAEEWMKTHPGQYSYNEQNILTKDGKIVSTLIKN